MRNLTFAFISLAAIGLSTLALASEISMHKHTLDELKNACVKAGGSFSQDSNGYACGTDCRGGPGTDCIVDCKTNQNCVAQVIGRRRPSSLLSALQAPSHAAR